MLDIRKVSVVGVPLALTRRSWFKRILVGVLHKLVVLDFRWFAALLGRVEGFLQD